MGYQKAVLALGVCLLTLMAAAGVHGLWLAGTAEASPDPGISLRMGDGVAVTDKPYLIMRNGGTLDISVSWNSVDDAPVKVVQGSVVDAQPEQGWVGEIQSPPVCNQIGAWGASNWICRPKETAGFSIPPVWFRLMASFPSDLQWTSLFVEINNPDLIDDGAAAGMRSSVRVPVAINSALVATPTLQSSQILSELQLNEEAFVVVDAVNPGSISLNKVEIEFSSGVTFSHAGGPPANQCYLINNPPNILRCFNLSGLLTKPIYARVIPTIAGPATVITRFYQAAGGTDILHGDYSRSITLPVIDGLAYIPIILRHE